MSKRLAAVLAVMVGGTPALGLSAPLDLTGIGYVQYGDAQVYSLPIANLQVGAPNNPGSPFYVQSGPGQIMDLVVIGTGSSGVPVTTNFPGMDNAFPTPSGAAGGPFFQMGVTAFDPPGGPSVGDLPAAWDSSLLAMKTFLAGEQMIVFFNNVQDNAGASEQSLAAWAQAWVLDHNTVLSGQLVGNFYDLTNTNTTANKGTKPYALVSEGGGGQFLGDVGNYTSNGSGPLAGTNVATDYVLAGGQICVLQGPPGSIPVPVPCSTPGASAPINHNLGANQAAYAVLIPELNAVLANLFATRTDAQLANMTLHFDIRLGCDPRTVNLPPPAEPTCDGSPWGRSLNGSGEQIFIGTARSVIIQVPEPGSLALLAMALLGLAVAVRRTRA